MEKISGIILIVPLVLIFITTPALAMEKYFSLSSGIFLPDKTRSVDADFNPLQSSYDAGWGVAGTIGMALDNGFRLENELVYRQAAARGLDEDLWALGWLVNIWFDIRNKSSITPYLGGGFGVGLGRVASPGPVDNYGQGIAYQAGGGLDFRIDTKMSFDLGYRYFGISDISTNSDLGGFDPAGSAFTGSLKVRY